jgi:hypothetical protein
MPVRELLAGFGDEDLIRLGGRLEPRSQMLGGSADLVDFGELAGDHVGDDMAGMEADPHLKSGIAEAADTPDKLDGCVARQRRVVVVGNRGAEDRRQSISQLLADDAAKLTYGGPHGRQCRFEARDSLLRLQIGNETGGVYDVGTKNRHKATFAVGVHPLTHCGSAFGAPAIVRIDRRLTREAMHSCAPKVAAILLTRIREQSLDKNTYRELLSNRARS